MHFSLFPAFFDHPTKMRFWGQEESEVVELFLRRHWVTNVPWIVLSLVGFILPTIIISLDQRIGTNFFQTAPMILVLGGLILWYMLILAYVLEEFLYWYFNIYIVTNQNIVDINFRSLMARDVVEVGLNQIQSQSAAIRGVFGPLFNFGDVVVETAAKGQLIDFIAVPKPDLVADRIQDLRRTLGS